MSTIIANDIPVAAEHPAHVYLFNTETKRPTRLTGLIVQVPEHISTGDIIKVNTFEYKFMKRSDST
jgi:elongation factor P